MGATTTKGKQQILLRFLPGKTFDFPGATIARVRSIRGFPQTDLNAQIVLRRVWEDARAWPEEFRFALRDDVLRDPSRFVLLDPQDAQAELFPRVFWCDNRACGLVFDFTQRSVPTSSMCPTCRTGKLQQLRFVKIHRCGALQPLVPPRCDCGTSSIALDTRGSERIANFRWVCRRCGNTIAVFGGPCRECQRWQGTQNMNNMDIEVHRAARTFYAHYTVLLNVPNQQLDAFFSLPTWFAISAAKYLEMPEVAGRRLSDFVRTTADAPQSSPGLAGSDLDLLIQRQRSGELTPEQLVAEMQRLREERSREQQAASPQGVAAALVRKTGVPLSTWADAGQELLEVLLPVENGQPVEYRGTRARELGLSRFTLVNDFPIVTATYGYSRAEYSPRRSNDDAVQSQLNPFPSETQYAGRFPIYVDQVEADALLLRLDHDAVLNWLASNDMPASIAPGEDPALSRQAFFAAIFQDAPLRQTLEVDRAQTRMVFGLLHTLSHIYVRQAALLCGLEATSLSEYLFPRALSFAIYCNHRFGATIGALTALFEQSADEWLRSVFNSRQCVYDPVCRDSSASCHACTHLGETSCRYFNLNLSRSFLFGGPDIRLGRIRNGYIQTVAQ